MPPSSPHDILDHIQSLLGQGTPPARLITDLLPRTRDEAIRWGRLLPGWDEERGRYPDQAVAIARIVSRQALRAYGLALSDDGRVIERAGEGAVRLPPGPSQRFRLAVADEEVGIEYTPGYFPRSGTDHFSFVSPHDPPRPHPLSVTGHWSHFALHDAVEACGGPHAYAALYAAACLRGEEKAFAAAFEGAESKSPRRPKTPPPAVLGEHTDRVIGERVSAPLPEPTRRQRLLF